MEEKYCFVAVEFVDDPNVAGNCYWYVCDFWSVKEGDTVTAPLGRHNGLQDGIVRKVSFLPEADSPFPFAYIKRIKRIENK